MKYRIVIIIAVLIVAIAAALPRILRSDTRPQGAPDDEVRAASGEAAVLQSMNVEPDSVQIVDLEFPKGVKRGAPLKYNLKIDHEKHLWKWLQYGQPNDLPQIEIRFVDGTAKPFHVLEMRVQPIVGGKTVPLDEREISDVPFLAQDEFRGAHAVRLLLARDLKQEGYEFLCMGRQYLLTFAHMGYKGAETPKKWGCKVITIPRDVKRGQLAIVEVDVTSQKDDPARVQWKKVQLTFKEKNGHGPFRILMEMKPAGHSLNGRIAKGEDKELKLWEYGGALIVYDDRKEYLPNQRYARYYRETMDQEKLTFPKDADLVATPETVVTVSFQLPEGLPGDIRVFWLLAKEKGKLPLAWANGPLRTKQPLGESIQFTYIPGTFFLAVLRDSSNDPEVLGKITFTKADAGKTIEIQPLQESP